MSTATIAQVADVVSHAASDWSFRQQLVSDPASTLASAGISLPSGVEVKILENTDSVSYLILPPRPSGVSDADLQETSTLTTTANSIAEKLDAWGRLVIQTWVNSDLKSRLLQDPKSVLSEYLIPTDSLPNLQIVENSDSVSYLVLPNAGS